MDEAELREMLRKSMPDEEFDAWIKAFFKRKYDSDFSREMTRSVEKYLEQFRK